ncbi:3-oxoacyl-[acyl-carrier-protein] reductase FabG [Ephemeroptericola cinctiostellae]|uniref:3-oxoacyl-[acyl-carrier-protein] reductase n=1 Tax=Ephemeroptericola cinctiostellae TaxID=2268024 RepID=A0A345DBP9_9BURK|nr:3-oxoacyl-ACP reductase FabG [Ephemeroptericola cinctiostellae]AXF85787.1 3-oxoacyl-[acyl-carrier-protein] reductase FabG [Ephemeroptericola cinctiostellae]
MNQLDNQIALVTGASRGIGRAIARTLAERGAIVVGTATSEAGAADIAKDLQAINPKNSGMVLNVADTEQTDAVLAQIEKEVGAIAILVNNAGITRDGLTMRMKDDDFDAVIATNLRGVFRLSRGVMRGMMKARAGRIINVTSVVAQMGNPGQANYAAAKAGVEGMARALAKELGSRNITVNCVAPGFIETDMTAALGADAINALAGQIPMARLGQVQDIANAVAFLASTDAAYITGQVLAVNGGMYM